MLTARQDAALKWLTGIVVFLVLAIGSEWLGATSGGAAAMRLALIGIVLAALAAPALNRRPAQPRRSLRERTWFRWTYTIARVALSVLVIAGAGTLASHLPAHDAATLGKVTMFIGSVVAAEWWLARALPFRD